MIPNPDLMKPDLLPFRFSAPFVAMLPVLLLTGSITNNLIAQLPDCTSGNTMYGVFNNAAGSTTADSMEIRPINYATGTVGPLMGGKRYWIRKQIGTTYYYGSAALGVNPANNHFYVITQMSSAGAKDIIAIDPVTATSVVVGTTPTTLNNYHFVKLAIAPNGIGYAIGVNRDTSQPANTFNPLIRFSSCGFSPTAGCATSSITILGYLPTTGNMYKWLLFNGDLAFDASGNLFFATAAYENVAGRMLYTDARLFKIDVGNIPSVAGTGIIPMTFLADYNPLDSTVINGIAFDVTGNMYFSTKRFTGPQYTNPPSNPELYKSAIPGQSSKLTGFATVTPNFSISDLASCNYPNRVLAISSIRLTAVPENGRANLKWEMTNNKEVKFFELQRSADGNTFETIASISATDPDKESARYFYADVKTPPAKQVFYRVRASMQSGIRNYSNVANVLLESKIMLIAGPNPNPFTDHLDFTAAIKSPNTTHASLIDQTGRVIYQKDFVCQQGENKIVIEGLGGLSHGMYIAELKIDEEVIRTKLIKQ